MQLLLLPTLTPSRLQYELFLRYLPKIVLNYTSCDTPERGQGPGFMLTQSSCQPVTKPILLKFFRLHHDLLVAVLSRFLENSTLEGIVYTGQVSRSFSRSAISRVG